MDTHGRGRLSQAKSLIAGVTTATALALGAGSCSNGSVTPNGNVADGGQVPLPEPCPGTQPSSETERVFAGMKPACEGCHSTGVRGFFASANAFQNLIVADGRLVMPGKPDESELVRLLEARGTSAFKQMPPAGPTYAQLVTQGVARVSIAEVRGWIVGLGVQARDPVPDARASRIVRLSALQIQRALYQQLGVGYDDFFTMASNYGIAMANQRDENMYPMQGPDAFPASFYEPPAERFLGLGGGATVRQLRNQLSPSPTFVQVLTQVSQAWCRIAIAKKGNSALFPNGAAMLTTDPVEVKRTLTRWWFHFLAERPSQVQVDALYDTVFVPLNKEPNGTEPAYVGSCSYFIRHPHWLFY